MPTDPAVPTIATRAASEGRSFVERVVIAIALVTVALLAWRLRDVLLLAFGAAVLAVLLRAIAEPVERVAGAPSGLALALVVTVLATVVALAAWLFGSDVAAQARELLDRVPQAWREFEARLGEVAFGARVTDWIRDSAPSGSGVLAGVSSVVASIGAGLADAILVVVGGIYLAAQPALYRRGLLALLPPRRRAPAGEAFDDSARALRLWLIGQLVSMVLVGTLTGLGLWWIGVPSALLLGVLAGLLDFVPIVGPVVAAIPAVLIALVEGTDTALWTVGLYLVVQQIEGNVLQPLVQQRAVHLPPALLLFSLVGAGLILGATGVLLAAPLTVVCYVLVKRLYVREALHTPTEVPGERSSEG